MTLLVASVFMMAMYCRAEPEQVKLLVYRLCAQSYGTVITTLHTNSLVACSIECSSTPTCQSVWYNNQTRECQLVTEKAPALDTSCNDKLHYAEITTGIFGGRCRDSSDCKTINGFCSQSICDCPFGHSLNTTSDTCFAGCHTYGTTFAEIKGMRLARNNNKQIDVTSEEAKEACLIETDFVCRSVDCYAHGDRCWLSTETIASKVNDIETNDDYNYYNRNCE